MTCNKCGKETEGSELSPGAISAVCPEHADEERAASRRAVANVRRLAVTRPKKHTRKPPEKEATNVA